MHTYTLSSNAPSLCLTSLSLKPPLYLPFLLSHQSFSLSFSLVVSLLVLITPSLYSYPFPYIFFSPVQYIRHISVPSHPYPFSFLLATSRTVSPRPSPPSLQSSPRHLRLCLGAMDSGNSVRIKSASACDVKLKAQLEAVNVQGHSTRGGLYIRRRTGGSVSFAALRSKHVFLYSWQIAVCSE